MDEYPLDVSEGPVLRFLRFICELDCRSRSEMCDLLGMSKSTFKRHLALARALGMQIRLNNERQYFVDKSGPFDLDAISEFLGVEFR